MARPKFRTHSLRARSTPTALRHTYQAGRLLCVSQYICAVPLPNPPSGPPHGLVHTIAMEIVLRSHSSARECRPP
jgi:hypothetical protein